MRPLLLVLLSAGAGLAQNCPGEFSGPEWLTVNYRHAPATNTEPAPVTPAALALAEMERLQAETLEMVRAARESANYYATAEAVREARANAEAIEKLARRAAAEQRELRRPRQR